MRKIKTSLVPNWPAPSQVHAQTLTPADLSTNQAYFHSLQQVHKNHVCTLPTDENIADGAYTSTPGTICAIKTADCLALLICNRQGTEVAALHAGWRGLAAGILNAGIKKFSSNSSDLLVWIAPSVCPAHYEIDAPVRDVFITQDKRTEACFYPTSQAHWQADLQRIARLQLNDLGIENIFSDTHCTFEDPTLPSYRRDPTDQRRLIHQIWFE